MATLTYMPAEHVPVLAPELIALVDPRPGDLVVDCTFGGGGHARLAAERIGPTGRLIAIDRDPAAAERFAELEPELACESRFEPGDYADVLTRLAAEGDRPDVIVLDLGISSLQLDNWERGFSYSYDAPLDMRMDPAQPLTALELVNEWPADRLETTIRELGEERHARSIAAEIARRRPLETTCDLVEAIRAAVPPAYRFGRGHPAKRTFQALRIAVNGELDSLDRGPRGRLGDARRRRATRGDLVPLARGPPREAPVHRARPRLRLPAAAPGLRLRARAGGGAALAPRRQADRGRDRAQPALALGAPAGGEKAGRRRKYPLRGRISAEMTMAGTATARTTAPARRAPARRRAPATRSSAARKPAVRRTTSFVPVAAAAGAVGGIADSGLFVWLTRGRLWIGLLGALLVGIVGLNVMALSFSASSSTAGQSADALRRQNSTLRAQIAGKLSNSEIQAVAAQLGLVMPTAGSIRYLDASPADAKTAAERLANGELIGTGGSAPVVAPTAYVAPETAPVETAPVETAPVETAPVETAPTAPVETAPVETAPVAPAEAAAPPATEPTATGGAVGAP